MTDPEDDASADDDLNERRRRRRKKSRERSARRWLIVGGVSVLLLLGGALALRYVPRPKAASDTVSPSTASETPPPKTASARDIILYFKTRGFVTSDVPNQFNGRPSWDLYAPTGHWIILVEFETEVDAGVLPSSRPYGRFALYAASDAHVAFLRQLYHALTGKDALTGRDHPGPMPPPVRR